MTASRPGTIASILADLDNLIDRYRACHSAVPIVSPETFDITKLNKDCAPYGGRRCLTMITLDLKDHQIN